MTFEHVVSYRKGAKFIAGLCFISLLIGWTLDLTLLHWKQYKSQHNLTLLSTSATINDNSNNLSTLSSDQITIKKTNINWTDKNSDPFSLQMKTVLEKAFSSSVGNIDIVPFYFKAKHDPIENDITILTSITRSRISTLKRLAERYQGPISVTVHITPDEHGQSTIDLLKETIQTSKAMEQYVDIHVVKDKMERQLNLWRNVARFFARTSNIMMLDVDFYLCTDFRKNILTNPIAMSLLNDGRAALVIPAFEFTKQEDGLDYQTFPTTKKDLLDLYRDEKIDMFHSFWTPGHAPSNYTLWASSTDDLDIYPVTTYQQSYEPYIVYKKDGAPWCDERFFGYGSNKAACLFEIYVSGIDFYVMPNDFIIHQTHDYPNEARNLERFYNRRLYNHFREEVCLRYGRMFLSQGEWESSKSANLIEQCNRLPTFKSTFKHFM
ncbi:glycosyl-transferase for dystroglycan-domain-containing protein [Cunninghamella echinulata]|nr:glycosyl-transferase for dystroglycan-domain-containing protein [Cunninghamella echinulata]